MPRSVAGGLLLAHAPLKRVLGGVLIEDRIREAKLGAGLRHLPSGQHTVNTVWMWAALLAGNLSVLLQALTGIDEGGRAHAARLRHQLLYVPARLIRHGRRLTLRLPPGRAVRGVRAVEVPRASTSQVLLVPAIARSYVYESGVWR